MVYTVSEYGFHDCFDDSEGGGGGERDRGIFVLGSNQGGTCVISHFKSRFMSHPQPGSFFFFAFSK